MRFFWLSARKDLLRYRRDAVAVALWFALPLVIAGMIGLVFGREAAKPQGLLLIADEDHGMAGSFLRESCSPKRKSWNPISSPLFTTCAHGTPI